MILLTLISILNNIILILMLINYKIYERRSEELSVCPYVACVSGCACVFVCGEKQLSSDRSGFKNPARIVRNIGWAGRVGRARKMRGTHKVVIGSLKGRCHLEDPVIEGKIILKLFLDNIKITLK
jgi:hypothetical protein